MKISQIIVLVFFISVLYYITFSNISNISNSKHDPMIIDYFKNPPINIVIPNLTKNNSRDNNLEEY
jgi:hypothetical protein